MTNIRLICVRTVYGVSHLIQYFSSQRTDRQVSLGSAQHTCVSQNRCRTRDTLGRFPPEGDVNR